jgi:arylsulfatase A-like enzyme
MRPLIEAGQTTVASLAQSQGYRTAMVGKWHLGFAEQGYDRPLPGGPVDRGFDSFFGIRASTDIPPYFYIRDDRVVTPPTESIAENHSDDWSPIQGAFWRAGKIAPDLELKNVLPRLTDEAVNVIRNHAAGGVKQPLMLYLAYTAPHTPWLPGDEFLGRSGAGLYGDFSAMVDSMIGRVLTALDGAGMARETLVILTSDNGPTWYPHDVERFGHDSAGGLRGMKGDAWEAGHRVPFVVRWPGEVPAATVCHVTIGFTDVLATLADLWGATLPEGAGPDSASFLDELRGQADRDQPLRESLVIESANGTMTIRAGDYKLITALGSGGFTKPSRIEPGANDPPGQLYDLAADRAERRNLYSEKPQVVARLQEMLADISGKSLRVGITPASTTEPH